MIDSLFFQAGNVNLAFQMVYEAICATVHLASNLERPALGRVGADQVHRKLGHRCCECGK